MINVDREKTNGRENRQVLEERAHFVCQLQMNQEIYWEYIRTILTRSKQFFISVCFTVMLSLFAITELDMSYVFTFAAIVIVNVIIWVRLKNNYRDLEKRKTNAAEKFCFLGETEVTMAGYDKKRQFADHRTISLRDVHRGIRVETPIDFVQQNALYRIA